ncbi:hypothetical protein B0H66DRAFT_634370 [Apodospora peruviana]|uniref:Uncharacterized protein n=1 Tax=Apodospora peruviana TaxID=516989 RepID=A0AAE0IQ76_9PEZI|nr:hypothetical protein B0H66DRAFT_634370 [Apodospora peruviana]
MITSAAQLASWGALCAGVRVVRLLKGSVLCRKRTVTNSHEPSPRPVDRVDMSETDDTEDLLPDMGSSYVLVKHEDKSADRGKELEEEDASLVVDMSEDHPKDSVSQHVTLSEDDMPISLHREMCRFTVREAANHLRARPDAEMAATCSNTRHDSVTCTPEEPKKRDNNTIKHENKQQEPQQTNSGLFRLHNTASADSHAPLFSPFPRRRGPPASLASRMEQGTVKPREKVAQATSHTVCQDKATLQGFKNATTTVPPSRPWCRSTSNKKHRDVLSLPSWRRGDRDPRAPLENPDPLFDNANELASFQNFFATIDRSVANLNSLTELIAGISGRTLPQGNGQNGHNGFYGPPEPPGGSGPASAGHNTVTTAAQRISDGPAPSLIPARFPRDSTLPGHELLAAARAQAGKESPSLDHVSVAREIPDVPDSPPAQAGSEYVPENRYRSPAHTGRAMEMAESHRQDLARQQTNIPASVKPLVSRPDLDSSCNPESAGSRYHKPPSTPPPPYANTNRHSASSLLTISKTKKVVWKSKALDMIENPSELLDTISSKPYQKTWILTSVPVDKAMVVASHAPLRPLHERLAAQWLRVHDLENGGATPAAHHKYLLPGRGQTPQELSFAYVAYQFEPPSDEICCFEQDCPANRLQHTLDVVAARLQAQLKLKCLRWNMYGNPYYTLELPESLWAIVATMVMRRGRIESLAEALVHPTIMSTVTFPPEAMVHDYHYKHFRRIFIAPVVDEKYFRFIRKPPGWVLDGEQRQMFFDLWGDTAAVVRPGDSKLGCIRPNSDMNLPVHSIFPEDDEAELAEIVRQLQEEQKETS